MLSVRTRQDRRMMVWPTPASGMCELVCSLPGSRKGKGSRVALQELSRVCPVWGVKPVTHTSSTQCIAQEMLGLNPYVHLCVQELLLAVVSAAVARRNLIFALLGKLHSTGMVIPWIWRHTGCVL